MTEIIPANHDDDNEHKWVIGKELDEHGWPDINWIGSSGPIVIYSKLIEEVEYDDNYVVQRRYMKRVFVCKIQWGGAGIHRVYAQAESTLLALQGALEKAVEQGCPPIWVGEEPFIDENEYNYGDDC